MSPGPYIGLSGPIPRDPATGAIQVSGYGVELGYAQNVAGVVVSLAWQDIAGVSIAVTSGARPFMLEAEALALIGIAAGGVAGGDSQIGFYITDSLNNIVATSFFKTKVPAAGDVIEKMRASCRISLAAGTAITYKLRTKAVSLPANTDQVLLAGAGNVEGGAGPISLVAREL